MPDIGYVRFVTHRMDDVSLTWQGVFHAVTELKRSEQLEPYIWNWLEHDLGWLNEHLPVPACFRERGASEGVCWFHPNALEPIARVRSLAALLREHGVVVRMMKSYEPGRLIYEDRWQIVAKPNQRLTWRRRKPRKQGYAYRKRPGRRRR